MRRFRPARAAAPTLAFEQGLRHDTHRSKPRDARPGRGRGAPRRAPARHRLRHAARGRRTRLGAVGARRVAAGLLRARHVGRLAGLGGAERREPHQQPDLAAGRLRQRRRPDGAGQALEPLRHGAAGRVGGVDRAAQRQRADLRRLGAAAHVQRQDVVHDPRLRRALQRLGVAQRAEPERTRRSTSTSPRTRRPEPRRSRSTTSARRARFCRTWRRATRPELPCSDHGDPHPCGTS